ncbi:hypothetical protein O3M35_000301 [Rhynocoris fuscipes]|uniref:Uncharacterized protein n=1 Tax=Rhynocoris fuscipes TaxID=488301 RepID=A0AAW1DNX1_9HEMI
MHAKVCSVKSQFEFVFYVNITVNLLHENVVYRHVALAKYHLNYKSIASNKEKHLLNEDSYDTDSSASSLLPNKRPNNNIDGFVSAKSKNKKKSSSETTSKPQTQTYYSSCITNMPSTSTSYPIEAPQGVLLPNKFAALRDNDQMDDNSPQLTQKLYTPPPT